MVAKAAIFYVFSTPVTSRMPEWETLNLTSNPAKGIPYTLSGSSWYCGRGSSSSNLQRAAKSSSLKKARNSSGKTTSTFLHLFSSTKPLRTPTCESAYSTYGFISYIGVPSTKSAPATTSARVPPHSSTPSRRTDDKPSGFGRKGERVANTPIYSLPPSNGGRTSGDHSPSFLPLSENSQMSHR